jgi:hypothetical protein
VSFSSVAFSLGVLFELLSLGIFAALLQAVIKSKDRQQININDFMKKCLLGVFIAFPFG